MCAVEDAEFACSLGESEEIGVVRLQYLQAKPARLLVNPVNSHAGATIDGAIAMKDIHVSSTPPPTVAGYVETAREIQVYIFIFLRRKRTWKVDNACPLQMVTTGTILSTENKAKNLLQLSGPVSAYKYIAITS